MSVKTTTPPVKPNTLNVFTYDYCNWSYPKNWLANIRQFFRNCKYAWQRATKGYCDRDVWDLSNFYGELFYHTILQLAYHTHSYPDTGKYADDVAKEEGYINGYDKWTADLHLMAEHFYNTLEDADTPMQKECDALYNEMEQYVQKRYIEHQEGKDYGVMKMEYTNKEKYEEASAKWLAGEKELWEFRLEEKDRGIHMLKSMWFNLWD